MSLSARRAWIEINMKPQPEEGKESLSARRAWIEINVGFPIAAFLLVALRKESVDRNLNFLQCLVCRGCRSPQGERG